MCSEYEITVTKKILEENLSHPIVSGNDLWNLRVKMSMKAPVIVAKGDSLQVVEKTFPVMPFPNARLSGAQFLPNGEAVVRRISDLPTWRDGFQSNPCVVPMTAFFEPAYWGKEKGNIVRFSDDEIMFVAGILLSPKRPPGPNLSAFALITDLATEFMLGYHHRQVKVLGRESVLPYLKAQDARQRFEILSGSPNPSEFIVGRERSMAKGWERRVAEQEAKLQQEIAFRKMMI
ncbi:SOS response-associated peptidase family protein [Bdellovibrio sp. BCCA]|uniref:SOS response-associated peptidase family protein n=1 Tax=Bdellovibrio sp. BCCA TaxID=3136281 RepID=UPI0030F04686